jgi:phenylacetic acid degradation protein
MTINAFENKVPVIGAGSWVHPSADVIGSVTLGKHCWIGPGARLRGDYGTIHIGDHTAVEDGCVIHARPDDVTRIGAWVTVGHGAIVHNATVHDWAVLGIGSITSDWAEIGEWAVVAEGAVVRQRLVIPERAIAVGIPARVIDKEVDDAYIEAWTRFKKIYVGLTDRYAKGFGPDLTPST